MDPVSKGCGGSNRDVQEEDRISNLPSCVIGHILSLLPTTDAVATSVLSKQWKHHWTLISRLDFDDLKVEMQMAQVRRSRSRSGAQPKRSFMNFVYRVLHSTSLQTRTFLLKCRIIHDTSDVIAWITMVSRSRNIRELDITVTLEKPVMLPWNLFTCETLVKVKLGLDFIIDLPTAVNLPCLKVLSLLHVKLLNEDSISRLLTGCPVLEELTMVRCIGKEVKAFEISAPALTSLNLTCLEYDNDEEEDTVIPIIRVVLRTPMLSYLEINDLVAHGYELNAHHCLRQAYINLHLDKEVDKEAQRKSLLGLLQAISKVNSLEFGRYLLRLIVSCKIQLPEFQNVIELKFGDPPIRKITLVELLGMLLKKMPRLTALTFTEGLGYNENYEEQPQTDLVPLEDVPDCLMLCLKKIEIMNFRGSKNELIIVEYFLENAKVLEELTIRGLHRPRTSCILLQIPRASPVCKVELLSEHNIL